MLDSRDTERLHQRIKHIERVVPYATRRVHNARRTWISILFMPFFALYMLVDGIRWVTGRLAAMRKAEQEQHAQFTRPEAMPDERTVADIVEHVSQFPFRSGHVPTQVAFLRTHGADSFGALFANHPEFVTMPHWYPPTFEPCLLEGIDGVQLAGMRAMHDQPGPALIICHGLLMTKNFDVIIDLARRAYNDWGFHVITIDLRGWGQSAWTCDMPSSAGYFEGRDVEHIAADLRKDDRVTSVGTLGYSLGGATVMHAAHVSGQQENGPINGGVLAVSAPTDVDRALTDISTKPSLTDPYFPLWSMFRASIRGTVRMRGYDPRITTWRQLVEASSLDAYDMNMRDFCARASVIGFAHEIATPVLELHAEDDFLVTVHHAEMLREATTHNPNVHVMTVPTGNHCAFTGVDARWYHSVVRRWFEYWAVPGK